MDESIEKSALALVAETNPRGHANAEMKTGRAGTRLRLKQEVSGRRAGAWTTRVCQAGTFCAVVATSSNAVAMSRMLTTPIRL